MTRGLLWPLDRLLSGRDHGRVESTQRQGKPIMTGGVLAGQLNNQNQGSVDAWRFGWWALLVSLMMGSLTNFGNI